MSIKDDNIPLADDDPQGNFDDWLLLNFVWANLSFYGIFRHNRGFKWQHQPGKIERFVAEYVQ